MLDHVRFEDSRKGLDSSRCGNYYLLWLHIWCVLDPPGVEPYDSCEWCYSLTSSPSVSTRLYLASALLQRALLFNKLSLRWIKANCDKNHFSQIIPWYIYQENRFSIMDKINHKIRYRAFDATARIVVPLFQLAHPCIRDMNWLHTLWPASARSKNASYHQ